MGEGMSPLSEEEMKRYEEEALEEAAARKQFEKPSENTAGHAEENEQLDQAV